MELVGKKDVTSWLGISERTLEQMVRRRQFPPPLRLGKTARWARDVVDAWLQAQLRPQLDWSPPKRRPSMPGQSTR